MISKKLGKFVVGYVRTSGPGNPKESIPNQIRMIQDYCKEHELIFVEILIDECETGVLVENRKSYLRLKEIVKSHSVDIVIIPVITRLGRTASEWIITVKEILKNDVEFISISENLIGSKLSALQLAAYGIQAEFDNRTRQRNCEDGLKNARRNGKFSYSTPPYGYRKDENKYLEIKEIEADQVRLIFDEALKGKRPSEIEKSFNQMGIKKTNGEPFTSKHIAHILQNKTYTGIIYDQKTKVEKPHTKRRIKSAPSPATTRLHPAIVTEEEFEQVQQLFGPPIQKTMVFHLLSGILYCPDCGAKMIANNRRNCYECLNRREGKTHCPWLLKDEIEPKVLQYIQEKEKINNQLEVDDEQQEIEEKRNEK